MSIPSDSEAGSDQEVEGVFCKVYENLGCFVRNGTTGLHTQTQQNLLINLADTWKLTKRQFVHEFFNLCDFWCKERLTIRFVDV